MPPALRPGRDDDAADLIALISACWAEYPGCVMDLDGENPELRALSTHYAKLGGALWVAEGGVGMVATKPLDTETWELSRLYVAASERGAGLSRQLMAVAEDHARAKGASRMRLWTDTRFDRAHRFYEKCGYVRAGPLRALDDVSQSIEFAYAKPLTGTVVTELDAAAAASCVIPLAIVLRDCVNAGASVSFLPPMDMETARAFWRRTASAVAQGKRKLFAGWVDGVLAGTVTLDLDTPPNQPHRAEIAKLLVLPSVRRRGLARLLMQHAEAAAAPGRTLLTLDTRAGDAAEPLYRSLGWQEAGRIPDYALNADGQTYCATVVFWKQIGKSG